MGNLIKKIVKSSYVGIASNEPVIRMFRKRLHEKIIVLMYHDIAEDCDKIESWAVVKKTDFLRQMEYISKYYNIIPTSEAVAMMGSLSPSKNGRSEKPSIVITFDDGYSGNKRVMFPIISSMNIPVTIFVATEAIQKGMLYWFDKIIYAARGVENSMFDLRELSLDIYKINKNSGSQNWAEISRLLEDLKRISPEKRENIVGAILKKINKENKPYEISYLSIPELRDMANNSLVTIGAHSHSHNLLNQLTSEEVSNDVGTSKALLESWLGRPVEYFAYPNGNYNNMVIEAVRRIGFSNAFTTIAKPWGKNELNFEIPRIGIGRYDSMKIFKTKIVDGFLRSLRGL